MVTCYQRYLLDTAKVKDFEQYARLYVSGVERLGGTHLGIYMQQDGRGDYALAMYSFPDAAALAAFDAEGHADADIRAAAALKQSSRCFLSEERTLVRRIV